MQRVAWQGQRPDLGCVSRQTVSAGNGYFWWGWGCVGHVGGGRRDSGVACTGLCPDTVVAQTGLRAETWRGGGRQSHWAARASASVGLSAAGTHPETRRGSSARRSASSICAPCHVIYRQQLPVLLPPTMASPSVHKRRPRSGTLQKIESVSASPRPCCPTDHHRRTDPNHHLAGPFRPQTWVYFPAQFSHPRSPMFLTSRQPLRRPDHPNLVRPSQPPQSIHLCREPAISRAMARRRLSQMGRRSKYVSPLLLPGHRV